MATQTIETASIRSTAAAQRTRREPRKIAYVWLLPALVVSGGIVYYGIGATLWISLLKWDGVSADARFIGLANYAAIFSDPIFWSALAHTVIFCVVILIQLFLGFIFAAILHSRVRFVSVYKVILFVPAVIAPAIMAPVFRDMFSPGGAIDGALRLMGLGFLQQAWIAQPETALLVVMLINIWQWTGFSFLLYFAGMTQIDQSMLEAARIDGASTPRVLRSIVFPSLKTTTTSLILLGIIGALKTFDVPFLVTGGGPNHASEFLATYLYTKTIAESHAGYGSAIAIVLLLLSIGLAIAQNTFQKTGRGAA